MCLLFRTIERCGLRYIAPDALKHNLELKTLWVISYRREFIVVHTSPIKARLWGYGVFRTSYLIVFTFISFLWIVTISQNWQKKDIYRKTIDIQNHASILEANYIPSAVQVIFIYFSHWFSFVIVHKSLRKSTILNFVIHYSHIVVQKKKNTISWVLIWNHAVTTHIVNVI